MDLCDVEAVPHSINCSRPFQLRHGESVAVMTEVEGNLCKQKQLKRIDSKQVSVVLLLKIFEKYLLLVCLRLFI